MPLVPGVAITNAIREILSRQIISGIVRTVDAVFVAGAIGSGVVIAIVLTQVVGDGNVRLLVEFIVSVLSSIGFGVITNIPKRALLPAGITGGVSWCAYWLISLQDHSLVLPNFTATVVIGLLGNYFAIRHGCRSIPFTYQA